MSIDGFDEQRVREKLRRLEQDYPGLLEATLDHPEPVEELFNLVRCWSPTDPPREQVQSQNRAEEEFDWYCEQVKLLGMAVSPIKRSMRMLKDEDDRDWLVHYYQRAKIKGPPWEMQHLKDIMDKKCPPMYRREEAST